MHPKFWEESFELDPHNKLYQVGLSHNDPNGTFIGFLFPKFTDSLPKNLISYLALAILIKVLVLPQSLNLAGYFTRSSSTSRGVPTLIATTTVTSTWHRSVTWSTKRGHQAQDQGGRYRLFVQSPSDLRGFWYFVSLILVVSGCLTLYK